MLNIMEFFFYFIFFFLVGSFDCNVVKNKFYSQQYTWDEAYKVQFFLLKKTLSPSPFTYACIPPPTPPTPLHATVLDWDFEMMRKGRNLIYIFFVSFIIVKVFFSLSINNYIFSYVFFIYVQMHCITFHSLLAQGLCVRSYFLCSCEFVVLGKYFVIYIFFFSSVFVLSEISC